MIRPADLEDIPRLVEMGARFIASTTYRDHVAINPAQMDVFAARLILDPNGAIFVADDGAGRLVGMIGMFAYAHHLSAEVIATETFWWVDPDARGAGVRLLRAADQWARDRGAKYLQMVAPTERIGQFYERLGFRRLEATYQRVCAR